MRVSPLRGLHQQAEASLIPYGPPEADVLIVETFGELELEYAALRKGCILLDRPSRGVLEVTGPDRLSFLNRMLTQELKGFEPFHVRRAFWLNRKGRIDADLRLIELGDRTLLDLDIHAVARTLTGLAAYIITEDVRIADLSESTHRLALHGPTAAALLAAVSRPVAGRPVADLLPDQAGTVRIADADVTVDRDDSTGEPGFELLVPAASAAAIYQLILESGHTHDDGDDTGLGSGFRLRPAGWHANNIARIEAGRPLYYIDFGPDSLPHESGVLHDRVSFKKGCYLGQEIVARMESRGHSKRTLVALRCELSDPPPPTEERPLPIAGAQIWPAASGDADAVGVITSSTLSPMLGAIPICFAAVKPGFHAPGTRLLVAADGLQLPSSVNDGLVFWKR